METPDFLDGESFLPVVAGQSKGKAAAFSQIRPVKRKKRNLMAYSVRTKDFRYVEWREPDKANAVISRELYDHQTDPEETISVIDNPKHAESIKMLEQLVRSGYQSLRE